MNILLKNRLIEIDFLRGIAVILVLFNHVQFNDFTRGIGWIGVDLFFVLSGFLVGGLMFKEYIATGDFKAGRFLIRRGFKIYPAFYFFLLVSMVVKSIYVSRGHTQHIISGCEWMSELFFLQNYICHIWNHTWSLAVEEHFYLLLTGLFIIALRIRHLKNRIITRAFLISFLILCLVLRIYVVMTSEFSLERNYYPTHLRIDSLFFGVLLADIYHHQHRQFSLFFKRYKYILTILVVILLMPLFLLERSHPFINSFGFSGFYLAFGIITGLFISTGLVNFLKKFISAGLVKAIAMVGYYSYSIYLWHLFIASFFLSILSNSLLNYELHYQLSFLIYFIASIVTGIMAAKLIEFPMLKVRERFFPSTKNALPVYVKAIAEI